MKTSTARSSIFLGIRRALCILSCLPALGFGQALDLLFSEYVEGSASNKALEIFNGTGAAVSLDLYDVALYSNGNTTANTTVNLSSLQSSLADGSVVVLRNSGLTAPIPGDVYVSGVVNFNGDDAIALLKNGAVIDVIGVIGVRDNIFANQTLRRKSDIGSPVTVYDANEWDSFSSDTFDDLGQHTFIGGGAPDPEPSEYPTGLSATVDAEGVVTLTWTDAGGTDLPSRYVVYGWTTTAPTLPADGTVVSPDVDFSDGSGALMVDFGVQTAVFTSLLPNTDYQFILVPYSNSGLAADYKTDGTPPGVSASTPSVALKESFVNLDGWTVVTLGADAEWVSSNGTAVANAFGSSGPADDWLISGPLDLSQTFGPVLRFEARQGFDDSAFNPALSVLVSTDYDGTGLPASVQSATWTALDVPLLSTAPSMLTATSEIALGSFGSPLYLAFQYVSSGTAGSSSEEWQIDNAVIFSSGQVPVAISVIADAAFLLEGDSAVATVTLSREPDSYPFVVAIESSDTSELTVPDSLSFDSRAEGLSKSFPIDAVIDGIYDLDTSAVVSVTAPGLAAETVSIMVGNTDSAPPIALSVSPTSIFENAGPQAATLTIRLPSDPLGGYPLTVALKSSAVDEATVVAEVTFVANDNRVRTVAIAAVTDAVMDGNQLVTLTASAVDFAEGTTTLEVLDVDTTTQSGVISLSIAPSAVDEGGFATGTLTLSVAPVDDLAISLLSTDSSEATVPARVTVPAMTTVLTFQIASVLDGEIDADQTVSIVASAAQWVGSQSSLIVRNVDVPTTSELMLASSNLTEGHRLLAELRLNKPASSRLPVVFAPSDDLILPSDLYVEAGTQGAFFEVEAIAGDGFEPDELLSVSLSLSGYPDASASLTVVNGDPRGTLLTPLDGSRFSRGETLVLEAVAADPIATLKGVSFRIDGVEIAFASEPPFEATYTIPNDQAIGSLAVSAVAIDDTLGSEVLGTVRSSVVFSPPRIDGDFVEQVYLDLRGEPADDLTKATLLEDLALAGSREVWFAEFLLGNGDMSIEGIQVRMLVHDRLPSFADFQSDRLLLEVGGTVGLAESLLASEEAVLRFGEAVDNLNTTAFFTPVWETRHGVKPTVQQIVQASSRIANYAQGRADFIRGLIQEDVFPGGLDIIYNPPGSRLGIEAKAALARLVLWTEDDSFDRRELSHVEAVDFPGYLKSLLFAPSYWSRFNYAWLDSVEMEEAANWFESEWFGTFTYTPQSWPWIFHLEHGWIAAGSDTALTGGFWWYDLELGWLWSSEKAYSWVFQAREKSWLWYFAGSRSPRYFYDTQTAGWLEVD